MPKKTKIKETPPTELALGSVKNSLRASASSESNVIKVAFEWPDPVIAANVLNTLIEVYLDQHLKVHTDPQTYTLLEEQAGKWETQLWESERRLQAFKSRHSDYW